MIEEAIKTVDEMLRKRKDKMQIMDCLAISEVLKDRARLEARFAELEEAIRTALEFMDGTNSDRYLARTSLEKVLEKQ